MIREGQSQRFPWLTAIIARVDWLRVDLILSKGKTAQGERLRA